MWIDDVPENNETEIQRAMNLGIKVQLFLSTSKAVDWIDRNLGTGPDLSVISTLICLAFLIHNSSGDKVRVITDLGRAEQNTFNNHAGEDILNYFRQKHPTFQRIPVLVYTSDQVIFRTRFVEGIPLTGSTSSVTVVNEYIDGLAGLTSNVNWTSMDVF